MLEPEPGTVVLVVDGSTRNLRPAVVLTSSDEGLVIVPICGDVRMAAEWDLLLDRDVLGYTAFAEVWNWGTVLPEQVHEVVAQLSPDPVEDLRRLARAARRATRPPNGVRTGAPILDEADPRAGFQYAEGDALRSWWAPALALSGAASLGELVRHRRAELGLGDDVLPALEDLEHDRAWLPSAVPAKELACFLRTLRLAPSRRLGRLTRSTLEALQPRLARGGSAGDAPNPDAYVEEVLREMEADR